MTRLMLAAALSLTTAWAAAQSPEQFTKNALTFATRAAYPMVQVQATENKSQWVQTQARVANSRWAVKPQDPHTPVFTATASFDLLSGVGEPKDNKAEAEDTQDLVLNKVERMELEYKPTANGWAFSKGSSTSRGVVTPLTPADVKPNTPLQWVVRGFSVNP